MLAFSSLATAAVTDYTISGNDGNGDTFSLVVGWDSSDITHSTIISATDTIAGQNPTTYQFTNSDLADTSTSGVIFYQGLVGYPDQYILAVSHIDTQNGAYNNAIQINLADTTSQPTLVDDFSQVSSYHFGASDSFSPVFAQSDITITSAPVPEPEEWAMLLLGLPLISWVVRRKQALSVAV